MPDPIVPAVRSRSSRAKYWEFVQDYRTNTDQPANAAAGHYADTAVGAPWFIPAAVAVGAGGLYGGYRLVDWRRDKSWIDVVAAGDSVDDARTKTLTDSLMAVVATAATYRVTGSSTRLPSPY